MLCGAFLPPTARRNGISLAEQSAFHATEASALLKQSAFGTPEVCQRKDAGGIFSRRKVPSQEREPKSEARLGRTTKASALLKQSAFGTPEGTRTPHLLLRRQLLYPNELLAHGMERVTGIEPASPAWKAGALPLCYTRRQLTHKSALR